MSFTVVFIVSSSVQSIPNAVRAKGQTRPLTVLIAVLIQYRSGGWTRGRTDTRRQHIPRYSTASRVNDEDEDYD